MKLIILFQDFRNKTEAVLKYSNLSRINYVIRIKVKVVARFVGNKHFVVIR
jgi:hypothetical protein